MGLIVGGGCCKRFDSKATIQLHCIPVKKKEELPLRGSEVQGSKFEGSEVRGSEVHPCPIRPKKPS
jgi:hypothetical protein